MADKATTTDMFEAAVVITKGGAPFSTYSWHNVDRKSLQLFQHAIAEALLAVGDKGAA